MNFMQTMLAIQKATTDARARTNNQTLGTRLGKGKLQVVRVVKHAKGPGCDVFPVTEYLPIPEAIHALNAL